ncbi:MAG: hypothetical protein LKJ86_09420 [Oscillibacter sp.]|jgi:FlaG/FlaF family flagellin (archaellin)|nr:hypothetical protein [Oscillibacter sp.]
MNRKAPLALMEQLIMVAVFALAAAVCVQTFTLSNQISKKSTEKDQAVMEAETAAEIWKSCAAAGDADAQCTSAAEKLGGTVEQGALCVRYDENWNRMDPAGDWDYQVTVFPEPADTNGLRLVTVAVYGSSPDPIYTLEAACQEAAS